MPDREAGAQVAPAPPSRTPPTMNINAAEPLSVDPRDRELAATVHALNAPMLRGRVEPYINLAERAIDFPALLEMAWSHGERAMLEIACTLWGRIDLADATLSSVLYTLDDENFAR